MKINQKGWVSGLQAQPTPNFNERPEHSPIDLLVIHSISLPPDQFGAEDVIAFFQNRLDTSKNAFYQELKDVKVSAHFFIKRDGAIIQFVSTLQRAWHAGVSSFQGRENCNDYSLGVEMEGCDTISFTEAQYQSLQALTRVLQQTYPAITASRIVSHAEVALPKGRKTDPGPLFDWDHYKKGI